MLRPLSRGASAGMSLTQDGRERRSLGRAWYTGTGFPASSACCTASPANTFR
jgi:hypothetical protein